MFSVIGIQFRISLHWFWWWPGTERTTIHYPGNEDIAQFKCLAWSWIFNGLAQDCSDSNANALELVQSCAKPSICGSLWVRIQSARDCPDSKVHGANIGPTWVLSAPDGPHVGPMKLAISGWVPEMLGFESWSIQKKTHFFSNSKSLSCSPAKYRLNIHASVGLK